MMKDIISVIVPIYNAEKYLRKCIESICGQTYTELDIILVDDGSNDDSGMLCDEYKRKDSRIQVIHKHNEGVARAREDGIQKSIGKYLMFVDADDFISLDFCEKMMKKMIKYDVDWVASNFKEIDGEHYSGYQIIKQDRMSSDKSENVRDYVENYFYTFVIWGKLFKRELFENYKFQNLKIGEDTCCMIDMIMRTTRSYLYNYEGYYYVSHDKAVTKSAKFNVNEYDKWKAHKYIFDVVSGQFPKYACFLKNKELSKFITIYHRTIILREKKILKEKLMHEIKDMKVCNPLVNKRLRLHVLGVKYFNKLYDSFLVVREKYSKDA